MRKRMSQVKVVSRRGAPRVRWLLAGVLAIAVGTAAPSSAATIHTPSSRIASAGAVVRTSEPASPPPFVGTPSSMCPTPRLGAQFYAPSIPGSKRTVALTFDDGPGPSTQAILDILERFRVRATFMNVGQEEVYRPSLVREEVADGFVIGDHTVDHPDLVPLSAAKQAQEVDGVIHYDRTIVATSPCVFRPPYGDYDRNVVSLVNSRRMMLWMWSVDTDDWQAEGSGSEYWIKRIVSNAESEGIVQLHPVVLMHNQAIRMPATIAALPTIITFFKEHHYVFVDLLGRWGPPGSCGNQAPPRVAGIALEQGSPLASGKTLTTPGGEFELQMQTNGDLVERLVDGPPVWSTRTAGNGGARLSVVASGDVEVTTRSGKVLWSTKTAGHRGARLVLGLDGDVAVEAAGRQLWSSGSAATALRSGERLKPGWLLSSPDGRCRLIQRTSGDLALVTSAGETMWSSGTQGHAGASTFSRRDGDLEVRGADGALLWASDTDGHGATTLSVLDTGQLAISASRDVRLWISP